MQIRAQLAPRCAPLAAHRLASAPPGAVERCAPSGATPIQQHEDRPDWGAPRSISSRAPVPVCVSLTVKTWSRHHGPSWRQRQWRAGFICKPSGSRRDDRRRARLSRPDLARAARKIGWRRHCYWRRNRRKTGLIFGRASACRNQSPIWPGGCRQTGSPRKRPAVWLSARPLCAGRASAPPARTSGEPRAYRLESSPARLHDVARCRQPGALGLASGVGIWERLGLVRLRPAEPLGRLVCCLGGRRRRHCCQSLAPVA